MAGIGAQKDESRKGGQVNPEGWVLAMAGFSCESDLFQGAGTLGLWHECLDKHFSLPTVPWLGPGSRFPDNSSPGPLPKPVTSGFCRLTFYPTDRWYSMDMSLSRLWELVMDREA